MHIKSLLYICYLKKYSSVISGSNYSFQSFKDNNLLKLDIGSLRAMFLADPHQSGWELPSLVTSRHLMMLKSKVGPKAASSSSWFCVVWSRFH